MSDTIAIVYGPVQKYKNLSEVLETLSDSSEVILPMCPRMCILGLIPKDINLSRANRKMVTLSLLQARRTIAK